MRAVLVLALAGALMSGCRTSRSPESAEATTEAAGGRKVERETERGGRRSTPVNEPTGKVASVNSNLRFVVIDFAFNPLPQVDQRMNVYREGQKVGEIRISGQSRNNVVAADITAGEARVGDEVRP